MTENNGLSKIEKKAGELPEVVKQKFPKIETGEDVKRAQSALVYISDIQKEIKDTFEPIIKSQREALRLTQDKMKKFMEPTETARSYVKGKIADYFDEQEKIKRKKEEEEKKRVEEERRQQEVALQKALELENSGQKQEALEEIEKVKPIEPEKKIEKPKYDGVHKRTVWKWEVENRALIPEAYWIRSINDALISQEVRDKKDKTDIPGIKVVPVTVVVER